MTNDLETARNKAEVWTQPPFDDETRKEVTVLLENAASDEAAGNELKERFLHNLKFGTGGMRATMGIGSNRMNIYTMRRAAQGVADYLLGQGTNPKPVMLCYDTRNNSRLFAREAAQVVAANGIKALIFAESRPTPMLSTFAREMGCSIGGMVTASHNPKEYNGFKVFAGNGQQVIGDEADAIIGAVNAVDYGAIKSGGYDELKASGMIEEMGPEYDDRFLAIIKKAQLAPELCEKQGAEIDIVYAALHGTGAFIVPQALADWGFKKVSLVEEQQKPDGNFPTAASPNPEEESALALGLEVAKKVGADLLLGTDPDTDRVGIAVKTTDGSYRLMSGQEVAVMLTYYVLEQRKASNNLPENGAVIKTIVTTDLVCKIAAAYGVECIETLTGFKYIGEWINKWDDNGTRMENPDKVYLVGGEESYGYLIGAHTRDKDAVVACCTIAEMAAWARERGQTLDVLLSEIHAKFGLFVEDQLAIKLEGLEGADRIREIMRELREEPPATFTDRPLIKVRDVQRSVILDGEGATIGSLDHPQENVLELCYGDDLKFTARPSGTEPKIKFYLAANDADGGDEAALRDLLAKAKENLRALI